MYLKQALCIRSFGGVSDVSCLGEFSKWFLGWDKTQDWHKEQRKSQAKIYMKIRHIFLGSYFLLTIESNFLNRILKQIVSGFLPPNFNYLVDEPNLETFNEIQTF